MSSPEETAVAAANLAFYRALEARNLSHLDAVWSHEDEVTCVHPGWHRLDGWSEVRRSEEIRVAVAGDLAWVACVEVIRPFGIGEEDAAAHMQATNVFRRHGGEWRLVHHHASASPSEAMEDEETVN
jgi:hypothetical protein